MPTIKNKIHYSIKMPSKKLIMIGSTVLVLIILVVVIVMFYKKDTYMYPSNTFIPVNSDTGLASLYSPSPVVNTNTNQYSALVADQNGNISTAGNVPVGIIAMWAGSATNIPVNWSLCDGTNGTPDLRSRFIVGASSDTSAGNQLFGSNITSSNGLTSFVAGTTGGEEAHALTTAEMPPHFHDVPVRVGNNTAGSSTSIINGYGADSVYTSGGGTQKQGGNVGRLDTNIVLDADGAGSWPTYVKGGQIDPSGKFSINLTKPTSQSDAVGNTLNFSTVPHNNMPPFFALAFIMKML
jgi:microcystin-dependent protein